MTLREILKKHNIKQAIVAKALGIHVNHLGRYDNLRNRTIGELNTISEATVLSVPELLGEDISINNKQVCFIYNSKGDVTGRFDFDYAVYSCSTGISEFYTGNHPFGEMVARVTKDVSFFVRDKK